jgi:hypothetical protein
MSVALHRFASFAGLALAFAVMTSCGVTALSDSRNGQHWQGSVEVVQGAAAGNTIAGYVFEDGNGDSRRQRGGTHRHGRRYTDKLVFEIRDERPDPLHRIEVWDMAMPF